MNNALTIDDPLAGREVAIVITLPAGEQVPDERPALVSLGIAGALPVLKTGVLRDVAHLINAAWTAFGVQAQVAALKQEPAPEAAPAGEPELATEQVVATAVTEDEAAPIPPPALPATKPAAKNLSLF